MKKSKVLVLSLFLLQFACEKKSDEMDYEWKSISINSDINLSSICMINENVGYVGGVARVDSTSTIIHFKIPNDNGYNLMLDENNENYYKDYTVKNPEKVKPRMYKTVDGGKTWQPISTPFYSGVKNMQFLNENIGFVTTMEEGVFKTNNGGVSWHLILPNLLLCNPYTYYEDPFKGVRFIDSQTGFAFAPHNNSGSLGILLKTTDGGIKWDCISLGDTGDKNNPYPNLFPYGVDRIITFNSNDTVYLEDQYDLWRSTDKGENWEIVADKGNYNYFNTPSIGYNSFARKKTSDGGNTWQEFEVKHPIGQIITYDNNKIFEWNGSNVIQLDEDLAKKEMTLELNEEITDIVFTTSNTGYLVGFHGMIMKYENE
jgi:photosystem II stability/assembly factor-like uncharacterized protein